MRVRAEMCVCPYQSAIETEAQGLGMRQAHPERLRGLPQRTHSDTHVFTRRSGTEPSRLQQRRVSVKTRTA